MEVLPLSGQPVDTPKLRGGPPPEYMRLENLTSPEKIRELLHKTLDLSDEAFEDLVDDIGWRAARLVLRAKALNGDVKALELYFRVVALSRASRQRKDSSAAPSPENAVFVRRGRGALATGEEGESH